MPKLIDRLKSKLKSDSDKPQSHSDAQRTTPPTAPPPTTTLPTTTPPATTQVNTIAMASLPKTYKAIVVEEAGAPFTIKELPLSPPNAGEVLIKNLACGICFSDFLLQQGQFGPMAKWPIIPGHEVIGDVVQVGEGVSRWKVGDRVGGAWHGGHDGACRQCSRGLYQMCDSAAVNGITRDGGYAEYTRLRSEAVVSIPSTLDPATTAPLLCAGVTVFNSIRKLQLPAGSTVAVLGLGGLGHLAVQYARQMGYRVVAVSSSGKKRAEAAKLGAQEYIDTSSENVVEGLQKLGGADLAVVTAPSPGVVDGLIGGVAPNGKMLLLAAVGDVPINTVPLVLKGISVSGWPSGHALDSEEAVAFSQRTGVECRIEKFKMDQIDAAVAKLTKGELRFRAVLTF